MKTTFMSPADKTPPKNRLPRQHTESAQQRFMDEMSGIISQMYKANLRTSRRKHMPSSITQKQLQNLEQ